MLYNLPICKVLSLSKQVYFLGGWASSHAPLCINRAHLPNAFQLYSVHNKGYIYYFIFKSYSSLLHCRIPGISHLDFCQLESSTNLVCWT